MTIEDILPRLEAVRSTPNGYVARCPAHDDHHPSLSLKPGDKGVLVKCWSRCTVQEITASLGLAVSDLFYDTSVDSRGIQQKRRRRQAALRQREIARRRDGRLLDVRREAEYFIASMRHIDISGWPPKKLDRLHNLLADAYAVLEGDPLCRMA